MISGQEAERLLLDKGKNGFFLVRESMSHLGDYVLSSKRYFSKLVCPKVFSAIAKIIILLVVLLYLFYFNFRNDDEIVHIMIRNIDGYYDAGGGPSFPDLSELIDNYIKNPMVETGGTVVHLKTVCMLYLLFYVLLFFTLLHIAVVSSFK